MPPGRFRTPPNVKARSSRPPRRKRRPQKARQRVGRPAALSSFVGQDGEAFLKCALAAPDFAISKFHGIPDDYDGATIVDQQISTVAVSFPANKQTLIIVPPTPGEAHFFASVDIGASFNGATFQGVAAPQYTSLFVSSTNSCSNVVKFRYASLAAELKSTSVITSVAGSVQLWKAPLSLTTSSYALNVATTPPLATNQSVTTIEGLEAADAIPPANYSSHYNDGAYAVSMVAQPKFQFQNIVEGLASCPNTNVSLTQAGMFATMKAHSGGSINGMGDMDSIFILVTNSSTTTALAGILKTWACIEYQPNAASYLNKVATASPSEDALALKAYRNAYQNMAVAVRAVDNDSIWDRLSKVMLNFLNAMTYIPGPVGMAANGVSMITTAMRGLRT